MKGTEPPTPSLPWKCSTPELHWLTYLLFILDEKLSGRRGSNPRPTAWKAVALPTELLPQVNMSFKTRSDYVGVIGFEPIQPKQQIYSLPRLSNFGAPPYFALPEPAEGLEPPTS